MKINIPASSAPHSNVSSRPLKRNPGSPLFMVHNSRITPVHLDKSTIHSPSTVRMRSSHAAETRELLSVSAQLPIHSVLGSVD